MPRTRKRPTRKRTTRKRTRRRPTKRASAIKELKKTAKAAVKAGLSPGQIAGIAVGGTAVAGLGTAAGVMAARDQEFYADYRDKWENARDEGYRYVPTAYEVMRGYPQRLQKERAGYSSGTMRSLSGPLIQTYSGDAFDKFKQFKNFKKEMEKADRGKHRQNMSSIFDSIKAARPSIEARYERDRRAAEFDRKYPGLREAVESTGGSVYNKYGRKKRRRKRRKKRRFGGGCDSGHKKPSAFGKKKRRKVSKKPSAALRRLCKKHKVRLTLKRGKKRVYKSEKVLKKQCKNAMRKK